MQKTLIFAVAVAAAANMRVQKAVSFVSTGGNQRQEVAIFTSNHGPDELLDKQFQAATEFARKWGKDKSMDPNAKEGDTTQKLNFYAWFKNAAAPGVGPTTERPSGLTDVQAKAKWDAWKAHADECKDANCSKQRYVNQLKELSPLFAARIESGDLSS